MNYDPETGQIKQIYQQPTGATDAIAVQHDVGYGVCSNRNEKNGENEKKLQTQSGQKNGKGSPHSSVEAKAVGTCGNKEHN